MDILTLYAILNLSWVDGQKLYNRSCTSCHSSNPKFEAFGPAIHGSSYDLLYNKVKLGKYPEGYKPKRQSKVMPIFSHLTEEEIKQLHLYLNK